MIKVHPDNKVALANLGAEVYTGTLFKTGIVAVFTDADRELKNATRGDFISEVEGGLRLIRKEEHEKRVRD